MDESDHHPSERGGRGSAGFDPANYPAITPQNEYFEILYQTSPAETERSACVRPGAGCPDILMFDMAASRYKGGGGFNEEGSEGAQRGGGVTEGEVAGEKHCGDERESEGKRQTGRCCRVSEPKLDLQRCIVLAQSPCLDAIYRSPGLK